MLKLTSYLAPLVNLKGIPSDEHEKAINTAVRLTCSVTFGFFSFTISLYFLDAALGIHIYNTIIHILLIIGGFVDPFQRKFGTLIALIFLTSIGPILLSISPKLKEIPVLLTIYNPQTTLLISKDRNLATTSLIMELIKFVFIYPIQLQEEGRFESFASFLIPKKENLIVCVFLVTCYFVFAVLFTNYMSATKAIEQMKTEIEQTNKKLTESIKERENFILSLSHEVRNPLNVVLGNIELLTEEIKEPSYQERLRNTKICAELLLGLLNNVLDVGKADLNSIEVCPTECATKPLFEKVWLICEELISTKGIEAKMTGIDRIPPLLHLDHYRIAQIIFNIVGNAVKFTEAGGIRLSLSWIEDPLINDREGEIPDTICAEGGNDDLLSRKIQNLGGVSASHKSSVSIQSLSYLEEKHGILEIRIVDTGIGIPAENIGKIFEKFSNGRKLGTGIGLWITKIIVEKMNGKISAISSVGEGTTITIQIRAKAYPLQAKMPVSIETQIDQETSYQKFRVMIVDDVFFNADIINRFMSSCSEYEVVKIAENGQVAVEYYEECIKNNNPIHLITMDLEMPVMGGKEACRQIRVLEEQYKIPRSYIVVISGNCLESEVSECLNPEGDIRAQKFMRKPISKEEFTSLLLDISRSLGTLQSTKFFLGKVLIVDNDSFNRSLLKGMLKKSNIRSVSAKNGKEAVELFMKNHQIIDIILMDCEMEVMDGWTATQRIRTFCNENGLPCPPIYGITGHTSQEMEKRCLDSGMTEMLKKPVSFVELMRRIKN